MMDYLANLTTPSCKIEADYWCDRVPFLSNLTNLIDLVQKSYLSLVDNTLIQKDHYYKYLDEKSYSLCISLVALPIISNIYMYVNDWMNSSQSPSIQGKAAIIIIDAPTGPILNNQKLKFNLKNEKGLPILIEPTDFYVPLEIEFSKGSIEQTTIGDFNPVYLPSSLFKNIKTTYRFYYNYQLMELTVKDSGVFDIQLKMLIRKIETARTQYLWSDDINVQGEEKHSLEPIIKRTTTQKKSISKNSPQNTTFQGLPIGKNPKRMGNIFGNRNLTKTREDFSFYIGEQTEKGLYRELTIKKQNDNAIYLDYKQSDLAKPNEPMQEIDLIESEGMHNSKLIWIMIRFSPLRQDKTGRYFTTAINKDWKHSLNFNQDGYLELKLFPIDSKFLDTEHRRLSKQP